MEIWRSSSYWKHLTWMFIDSLIVHFKCLLHSVPVWQERKFEYNIFQRYFTPNFSYSFFIILPLSINNVFLIQWKVPTHLGEVLPGLCLLLPAFPMLTSLSYLSVVLNKASYVFFLVAGCQWGNENTYFPLYVVPTDMP